MRKLTIQSISLAGSFGFVFIWQNSPMSGYTLPLLVILLTIYVLLAIRKKNFDLISSIQNDLLGLIVLNTVIMLLIMMTGNYQSPLFFLLYFLSFGIAFGYKPGLIFVFVIGILLLLLPNTLKNDQARNILMLSSLIIISLVAFFFSQTYLKRDKK